MDLNCFKVKNAPATIYYIPNFITEDEEQMLLSHVYKAPRTKWTVLSHRRLQNWGGLPGPKGMVAEDLPPWLSVYSKKIADLGAFEGNVPNHVLVNEYESGQGIMPHEDGPAFYPTVSTISLGSHTLLDFYYHLSKSDSPQGQSAADSGAVDLNTSSGCETSLSPVVETVPSGNPNLSCDQYNANCECTHKSERHAEGQGACDAQGQASDSSLDGRHFLSLLLQPRSLVLVKDDMYKVHLHGIKEVTQDTLTDKIANLDLVPEVELGNVLKRKTRVSLTIRFVPKVLKSKLIFGKR